MGLLESSPVIIEVFDELAGDLVIIGKERRVNVLDWCAMIDNFNDKVSLLSYKVVFFSHEFDVLVWVVLGDENKLDYLVFRKLSADVWEFRESVVVHQVNFAW